MRPISLPALMYHDVGPSSIGTPRGHSVTPEQFEKQVCWLAQRGYVGIRPSDWVTSRRSGEALPRKPVIITFDDGYAGVAKYGLPILERYGFGAVVFVVTRRIGATNTWDQARGYKSIPLMSADEIVFWASHGIEFGCHTRTHPHLATLSTAEIESEIAGSREDLAAILNQVPVSFAYPWGAFNGAVHECVRGAFDLAFSTRRGLNLPTTDPHLLRRGAVNPDRSMLDFAFRVIFGFNPLGKPEDLTLEVQHWLAAQPEP